MSESRPELTSKNADQVYILSRGYRYGFLAACLALSLAARLIYWHRMNPLGIGDMEYYIDNARLFANGDFWGGIHYHYPPLYSIFIMLFHSIGIGYENSARLISVLAGTLTILPVWYLAKYYFNEKTAYFSALLWIFAWLDISVIGYAESLFCLIVYAGFCAATASSERRKWPLVVAGLLIGLANLAKSEALLFLIIIALATLFRELKLRKRMIPALALYLAAFIIVTSPYAWAYYHETGKLSLNPKSRTLFLLYNTNYMDFLYTLRNDDTGYFTYAQKVYQEGDKTPIEGSALAMIWNYPGKMLKQYLRRIPYAFKELYKVGNHIFPGALILFIAGFIRPRRDYVLMKRETPVYFALAAGVFAICLFDTWERFFASLFPLMVIGAGSGWDRLLSWLDAGLARFSDMLPTRRQSIRIACLLAMTAAFFGYGIWFLARSEASMLIKIDYEMKREIAEWLKPRIEEGDNIMGSSASSRVTWFLGISPRRQYLFPYASLQDTIDYGRQENVKYMVVQSKDIQRYRKFLTVFREGGEFPGLQQEVYSNMGATLPYAIYRILPGDT